MPKYCRSKNKFRTKMIKGSGNMKGSLIFGSNDALDDIKSKYGRNLKVVKTNHNKFQWVFYCVREKNG